MAKSKDDAAQMDDAAVDDMASLPPLRDRAPDDQSASDQAADARDVPRDAPQDRDNPEQRPVTPDEQRKADDREAHRQAQQRTDEERRGMEERERMASRPNRDALKLWVVRPADSQAPPFHLSSTPNVMLIVAETDDYARRLAVNEAGNNAWADENAVIVDEYKPRSPMVISRDFRG